MTDPSWLHTLLANPWVLAYLAGLITGWQAARKSVAYMLGFRR